MLFASEKLWLFNLRTECAILILFTGPLPPPHLLFAPLMAHAVVAPIFSVLIMVAAALMITFVFIDASLTRFTCFFSLYIQIHYSTFLFMYFWHLNACFFEQKLTMIRRKFVLLWKFYGCSWVTIFNYNLGLVIIKDFILLLKIKQGMRNWLGNKNFMI